MSANYLSHIIPTKSVSTLKSNAEYGFDILSIIPEEGDYQLVVTDGLRTDLQEDDALKHVELYFCLPEYFNLEQNDWPVHWLERIAQVPQKFNTWFGYGDSLPAGNPAEPLADNFEANHFMLIAPVYMKDAFLGESWKESFQMLGVLPIFQREIDFKIKNSHSMLSNKLKKANVDERVDVFRPDVCKKRFGIF